LGNIDYFFFLKENPFSLIERTDSKSLYHPIPATQSSPIIEEKAENIWHLSLLL
jgi:hypothetical protein